MKSQPLIEAHTPDARGNGLSTCLMLVALTAAATIYIQSWRILTPDVSFLAWTARQVMGPAVFGIDIYEVNPPLAFMIYTPAAVMVPLLGFDLAIKLWVTALGCLCVAMFWQTCDVKLRLPLTLTLALFIAFALPEDFAQREQIAFMLTAPYVAGPCRHRGRAILIGVMAGVGFAIKPYFLIPLVLVFATRRKIRTEEWAIAATGLVYAISLLLFFQPYLFDVIPVARATYWAVRWKASNTLFLAWFILVPAVSFSLAGAPQPEARGFLAATIGFALAALIQFKGFSYQFNVALGYLVLFLVARAFNARRIVAACAAVNLLIIAYVLGGLLARPSEFQTKMARLLPEIDRSQSFLGFSQTPLPGCPTLIYTRSEFKGLSCWVVFVRAAREPVAGPELRERARQLAIAQAIKELEREPELVIVERPYSVSGWAREEFKGLSCWVVFVRAAREPVAGPELRERARQLAIAQAIKELEREPELVIVERPYSVSGWAREEFDLLSFFKADARFGALWHDYSLDKTIDEFEFYRRRQ